MPGTSALWRVLRRRRDNSSRLVPQLCGFSRAAGACARLRWRGSLWQRRRRGPVSALARVRLPPQPQAPQPLGHAPGVLLWPPPLPSAAAAAASRLWARAGNMPLAAYCYLRVVGRGSYGEVTLVRHRRDGRQVGGFWARHGGEGHAGVRRSTTNQG